MKVKLTLCLLFAAITLQAQTTLYVSVTNPSEVQRSDQPVVISLSDYGVIMSALVTLDGKEIPCQLDDLDQDEQMDELCFLADVGKKASQTYRVELYSEGEPRQYAARVYAEMVMGNKSVKEKNKQNNFIESITARGDCAYSYNLQHHHGVDFESELNGIRIYFDQRQTLDLYGKYQKRLELQQTQFYTSAEQKAEGYGDDVLWVGNTFGLGAFRGWNGSEPTMIEPVRSRTQRIISYGPLRTIVEVIDRGWQLPEGAAKTQGSAASPATLTMTLRYTQYAGHRDTDVDVFFSRDASDYCFSTGVINVKGSVEFSDKKGLRACWGTDYPATDTLNWKRETVGLAVLVPERFVVSEQPANKDNYTLVVSPQGSRMNYKVAYCSANETFGFSTSEAWFDWLRQWRREVEHPIVYSIKKQQTPST